MIKMHNSMLNNINLIIEEKYIINNLPCPVTLESLEDIVKSMQEKNMNIHLNRLEKMHDNSLNGLHVFRYIVAQIIAEQWYEKFDNLKTKEEQAKMLDDFQNYLDKTKDLTVFDASKILLDCDCVTAVNKFIEDNKPKQNNQQQNNFEIKE